MEQLPDIAPFKLRRDELGAQMLAPSFYSDARNAANVSREHQNLTELIENYEKYHRALANIDEASALINDSNADPELRELAEMELPELEQLRDKLHNDILTAMIPPDPTDSRNTIMEIRAGTGGEEAALFASELTRMYQRYAEDQGWKVESLSTALSERGGFRETSFAVTGTDVYKQLKYESGVHRVQRVPLTEANGRIHTSTVTVAVLPEAQEVDLYIDPQDLEITVQRASGPGGQGVNTTDSAVRIIHKPTGMIVYSADGRSQQKNKASAMAVLRARLLQQKEEEERAKYAAERRSQIGTGDRSERIRTYNFPQSRLTDHRINLTLYNLPEIMEGDIAPVIEALQRAELAEKTAALTGNSF